MDLFQKWRELTAKTDGFFADEAAAVWDTLLDHQESRISGALGEIGVLYGKSAAMLALHTRKKEHLFLVDPYRRREHTRFLERLGGGEFTFFEGCSSALRASADAARHVGTFRWIHIDGEHTGEALVNDLRLSSFALHDEGVICLDDFFSPMYPQLTAATFNYLTTHPHELVLFLCGHNKGYLCRPNAAVQYQDLIRTRLVAELANRGVRNVTVFKTTSTNDHPSYGIGPRWQDYDYYGSHKDPSVLPP